MLCWGALQTMMLQAGKRVHKELPQYLFLKRVNPMSMTRTTHPMTPILRLASRSQPAFGVNPALGSRLGFARTYTDRPASFFLACAWLEIFACPLDYEKSCKTAKRTFVHDHLDLALVSVVGDRADEYWKTCQK